MGHGFWSSVELTGNQTSKKETRHKYGFWSSVELTGNQTVVELYKSWEGFWSSVELTGNQTGFNRWSGRRDSNPHGLAPTSF